MRVSRKFFGGAGIFLLHVSFAFASNDHVPGMEDLNRAIVMDPNSVDSYYDRGILWQKQGDLTKAIADFTQAIKIDPHDGEAYEGRANVYASKNDLPQAIADYSKALQLNPSSDWGIAARTNLSLAQRQMLESEKK